MALPNKQDNRLHGLLYYEYQPTSFPPYRYFVECVCGFQARVGTEEAAYHQLDSHLIAHGAEKAFDRAVTAPELLASGDGNSNNNEAVRMAALRAEKIQEDDKTLHPGPDDPIPPSVLLHDNNPNAKVKQTEWINKNKEAVLQPGGKDLPVPTIINSPDTVDRSTETLNNSNKLNGPKETVKSWKPFKRS